MSLTLHFAPPRRTLVLWLAVLLLVFGAVAPTLSHALMWTRGDARPMLEVCTSTGARGVAQASVANSLADAADGQESAPTLVHCPFCLLLADPGAPAPDACTPLLVALGEPEAAPIRPPSLFVTQFTLTPPPRGPPAFSLAIEFIAPYARFTRATG